MNQSSLRYFGALSLALVVALVGLFGSAALVASPTVLLLALAGLLMILAGSVSSVSLGPIRIGWRPLVGLSYALFALTLPVSALQTLLGGTVSAVEYVVFATSVLGGLTLLFIGYDIARGGEHFRITSNVERVVGW